jgi:hypothetical protein
MRFQFYYINPNNNKKCIIGSQECKRPQRTKLYKSLETYFNDGFIDRFGFEPYKEIKHYPF